MPILLITGMLIVSRGYCETFSFAVVADPHIDEHADHKPKLEAAVSWIINNKDFKDIELVFVVGDIAWGFSNGYSNLEIAKQILDNLNARGIPYIPVIGDNEVHAGCEEEFDYVFGEQYQYLSEILGNWQKAPTPVDGKYLQSFSFDHKDCHFVCADFISREPGDEAGELHDFTGGTWPWVVNDIENCSKPKQENIVIMTHIGMFRTGVPEADQYLFSETQMETITDFLYSYREYVDSNYAGHIHQNWYWPVSSSSEPIYHVWVTDDTWYDTRWPEADDEEITVRWVRVNNGGSTIYYSQHIEAAPATPQPLAVANSRAMLLLLCSCIIWRFVRLSKCCAK